MSLWIELRCDHRLPGPINQRRQCYSHDNNGPMGLVHSKQADLLAGVRKLESKGVSEGWRRTKVGWACPHCWEILRVQG